MGSLVGARGLICSMSRGIFLDRGSNPCPPHWQMDSQPLNHQGNPPVSVYKAPHISDIIWYLSFSV